MLYAKAESGALITASRGAEGWCPGCGSPLVPKCGQVNVHHWAHADSVDCDPWAEPMTEWHWNWQRIAPMERVEVVMTDGYSQHRADIVGPDGSVIEVQHSRISVDEIREREQFYGNMVWLFDAREPYSNDRIDFWSNHIVWKHPWKSISGCTRKVLIDIGTEVLYRLDDFGPRYRDDGSRWPGYSANIKKVARVDLEKWLRAPALEGAVK